jgi:REP element-mobilizing transposase RayT
MAMSRAMERGQPRPHPFRSFSRLRAGPPALHRSRMNDERLIPPLTKAEIARGFRGNHERGYLPHLDFPSTEQSITYRLANAMPAERRPEWQHVLRIENDTERRRKIEAYVDAGHGSCLLRDPRIATIVEESLWHFDGERYHLLAWVVMPNHVHVLIEMTEMPLPKIIECWKSFTSRACGKVLGRRGQFWQEDYFDRFIRNDAHHARAVEYIEWNPVTAGLVRDASAWPHSSARFRSADGLVRPWLKARKK